MFEILSYWFFQNAIIWWFLISIIASILGVFIVMRKEANVTHAISNFLFLWIALSLLLSQSYYVFAFLAWVAGSLLIFFIEKSKFISKESTKEIISQAWISWWIFTLGFLWNLTLDINNFLFGSILFITTTDLAILSTLAVVLYTCFMVFWKNFLAIIINEDIAKSQWLKVNEYNLAFLVFLSLFIAISIKIFWILLIGAFLVIPANISKIISPNLKKSFYISTLVSVLSVLLWLFASYWLETSSGATIVLILLIFFLWAISFKKLKS